MTLTLLFIFSFTILGMQLFVGRYSEEAQQALPMRFKNVFWGLITCFQSLTLDNWVQVRGGGGARDGYIEAPKRDPFGPPSSDRCFLTAPFY